MDSLMYRFLFCVSFGLLLVLCLGGTINRFERDDDPPNLSDLIPELFDSKEMDKTFEEMEKSFEGQLKKLKTLNKVLDQYPDKYNKTFSKTENIDGKDVVTNTTILKNKTGHSNAQMFIQQKTVGGDSKVNSSIGSGLMVIKSKPKIVIS